MKPKGGGRVAVLCAFLRQRHYGVRERSIRCSVSHGDCRGARLAVAHLKIRSYDPLTSQPRLGQNICDSLARINKQTKKYIALCSKLTSCRKASEKDKVIQRNSTQS